MIETFAKLIIGHAVVDFWAQSEALSNLKRRAAGPFWPYALTAHSILHGGAVWLITGSMLLGLAEAASHWIIDFGKCENWYGVHVDQAGHLGCKALWTLLA